MKYSTDQIREDVLGRFLKYVTIGSRSDENNESIPSSKGQFEVAELVKKEMQALGLKDIELDEHCYLYGTLPASEGVKAPVISLLAHFDTSPDAPGDGVKPIIRKYEGKPLAFPDDENLFISEEICPPLGKFLNQEIITASGKTLLGADDKAGIAEIMSALAYLVKHPELKHPELRICFTPDEETGRGTSFIRREKLGDYAYTLDGGLMGELEDECFNAWSAKLKFHGIVVHPGEAKNKMVNAAAIASRFVGSLPEWQTPEHTEKREGFFHVNEISGDETLCSVSMILRDFDEKTNMKRVAYLEHLKDIFEERYPGLKIELICRESYKNMNEVLVSYPNVTEIAEKAIEMAEIDVIKTAIRGGTDGARLSFMGLPTPNIFAGGLLFHSCKEWIPVIALVKATEVILNICELWTKE
jgi:tripeptide aminopeptidase